MKTETITIPTPGAVRKGDLLVLERRGSLVRGRVHTVRTLDFILENSVCVRMNAWEDIEVTREVQVAEPGDVGYATVRGKHGIKVMKVEEFSGPNGLASWVSAPVQSAWNHNVYISHSNHHVAEFRLAKEPDDGGFLPEASTEQVLGTQGVKHPTIQGLDVKAWYEEAQRMRRARDGAIKQASEWKVDAQRNSERARAFRMIGDVIDEANKAINQEET